MTSLDSYEEISYGESEIGPNAASVCSQFEGEKSWWMMAEADRRVVAEADQKPATMGAGDVGTNNREGGDRGLSTIGGGQTNTLTSINQATMVQDSFLEGPTKTHGLAHEESWINVSGSFSMGKECSATISKRRADNDNSIQKERGEDALPFCKQSDGKEKTASNEHKRPTNVRKF